MFRLTTVIGAVLALAGPAGAESRQFGGVIYPTLPGWGAPVVGPGFTMAVDLSDGRCPSCRIMIAPAVPASGDLAAWLDRQRFAFVDQDQRGGWRAVDLLDQTQATIADTFPRRRLRPL